MTDTFKALASETRRQMLNHLAGGPMTVGEIAQHFDMEMPSISKHLSILRDAGLIKQQKRGQHVLYFIAPDNMANGLYAFLAPFCPHARKIARQRSQKAKQSTDKES